MVGSKTGIIYNNEMDDFSTPNETNHFDIVPSKTNYIKPLKRPMSSMNPLIITKNINGSAAVLITGAAGGSHITTAVAQVTVSACPFSTHIYILTKKFNQLYSSHVGKLYY